MPRISRKLRSLNVSFSAIKLTAPALSLSSVLSSCLALSNLAVFQVVFAASIPQILDEDLLTFAKAWPKLRTLRLACYSYRIHADAQGMAQVKQPTLGGLLSLAQYCPQLTELEIPILDITSVPPVSSIPAVGRTEMRKLRVTELRNGAAANLLHVALIIDLLFPSLAMKRRISLCGYNMGRCGRQSLKEPWDLVRALHAAIQERRALEDPTMASEILTEDSDDEDGDDSDDDDEDY
ncbi:hypothetical protein NUW54_g12940 [Trametes sanguinea]|uniref:Uncharacterized protein n=1 Tax=Trametes sanguinea TaxID=158606 RepID=A0ACC1MS52_9APHY|nr:hypothetical protein NUW54_g12940 [Trametes sanguinea]